MYMSVSLSTYIAMGQNHVLQLFAYPNRSPPSWQVAHFHEGSLTYVILHIHKDTAAPQLEVAPENDE